jgi:hypothetical protein
MGREVKIAIRFFTFKRNVLARKILGQSLGSRPVGAYQEHIMTSLSEVIRAL